MSIFNCNLIFKMVEGDSLASTHNKLIAHSMIDENWNILSLNKARIAIQELNEEAKDVLGVSVRMFEEDGNRMYPNVDEFNKIDELKKIPLINPMKEDVDKQELINQVRNEIITRDERILPANTRGGDSQYQSNISPTNRRIQSESGNDNTLFQKVGERTFNEVWSSNILTDLERERYLLLCLQQKLYSGDTFNRRLAEKLNKQLGIKVDIKEGINLPYAFYVQNGQMNYDSKQFYNFFNSLTHSNPNEFLDLVLAEELIHIVTMNIISFKEKFFAIQQQEDRSNKTFFKILSNLYPGLNLSNQNLGYTEFIRMAVQQEFFGTTTELNRFAEEGILSEFLKEVWEFIQKLFKLNQTQKIIQKHIDFINDQQSNQEKIESDLILPVNDYEMSPTDGLYDFTCLL